MNTPMTTADLETMFAADGENVIERLDHWVGVAGDRTCVYDGERAKAYSFAEIGALTDRIAGNLARLGVAKGDAVSVFTTNSMLATWLMFGIWKAGAVYSPINFSYTGRLLAYQLNDTKPVLVITDGALLQTLNDVAGETTDLQVLTYEPGTARVDERYRGMEWEELTVETKRPEITLRGDDPANIIYTSGTTGPAKGVLQPHRWMAQYTFFLRLTLTSEDVVYNDLPMYHVGGAIANVVRAAWVGCEVAIWDKFSPERFWSRIAERRASTAILLDVMIPWLMKATETPDDNANSLNKVYMQPLPMHHHEVATRFGFDFVLAGFGQTESGAPLAAFLHELERGVGTPDGLYRGLDHEPLIERVRAHGCEALDGSTVNDKGIMGLPTPFMEVTVLDENDMASPVGQAGELAFRPRLPWLIMHEYLGKPEATVKAWRNLWFHTGDSAVLREDGMFQFVDRLGDRIRVRGENLSSFQVEDILNQHPQVQFCAVFAIASNESDEDEIVACVVAEEGNELTTETIEQFAADNMPKYMRPRHVRIVDDIPRTPTNKVEKYKLRRSVLEGLDR